MTINIVEVTTKEQLDKLYNDSALTIEGLCEDGIIDFADLVNNKCGFKSNEINVYVTKGNVMNKNYNLHGCNAYNDDLTIVSIMLSDICDSMKIVFERFSIGARWFDDIVDNNLRREVEMRKG